MVRHGCYEQAIEVIQKLYDPYERLKDREQKQKAYWAAKNAEDEETRRALWAKYKSIMDDSMFQKRGDDKGVNLQDELYKMNILYNSGESKNPFVPKKPLYNLIIIISNNHYI